MDAIVRPARCPWKEWDRKMTVPCVYSRRHALSDSLELQSCHAIEIFVLSKRPSNPAVAQLCSHCMSFTTQKASS